MSLPAAALRGVVAASWWAHLQPTPPGWLDMAVAVPLIDTSRARETLGWEPQRSSTETLAELMRGIADMSGEPTPPLEPDRYGRARLAELLRGGPARG